MLRITAQDDVAVEPNCRLTELGFFGAASRRTISNLLTRLISGATWEHLRAQMLVPLCGAAPVERPAAPLPRLPPRAENAHANLDKSRLCGRLYRRGIGRSRGDDRGQRHWYEYEQTHTHLER